MNTKHAKWINVITLIFLYAISSLMICAIIYSWMIFMVYEGNSYAFEANSTTFNIIFLALSALALLWLIFRCIKWSLEKLMSFERIMLATQIGIIVILLIFGIIKGSLTPDFWHEVRMWFAEGLGYFILWLSPIKYIYWTLVVALPALLVVLSFFARAEKLLKAQTALIGLYILSSIFVPPIIIMTVMLSFGYALDKSTLETMFSIDADYSPFYLWHLLLLLIPIFLELALVIIVCRLIKSREKAETVAAIVRFIGVSGLFLLFFPAFVLGVFSMLWGAYWFYSDPVARIMMLIPLTTIPYNIYAFAIQILHVRYGKELAKELLSEELPNKEQTPPQHEEADS